MPARKRAVAAAPKLTILTLTILLGFNGAVQAASMFGADNTYRIIVQRPDSITPFSGDFGGTHGASTSDAAPVANLNRTFAGQAVPLEVFKVDDTKLSPAQMCDYLRANNPDVTVCEADVRVWIDSPAAVPNDPDLPQQWALNDVKVGSVWAASQYGSNKVKVCMVDTGSDLTHPDLASNLWVNPGESGGGGASSSNGYVNGVDDDKNGIVDDVYGVNFVDGANGGNPQDDNGHGTFVAGVVGAVGNNAFGISGLNQVSSIISCKFMDAQGNGWASDAVRCFDYCVRMGAHVISNSWGGVENSDALQAAVKQIQDRGIVMVASAGNEGVDTDTTDHFPSTLPDDIIITVAASNRSQGLWYKTNYGRTSVDIAAPGHQVLGLAPGGQFQTMTGTSMATPHVAGAAALLLSQYEENGWDISTGGGKTGKGLEVKKLLLSSADNMPGVSGVKLMSGHLNIAAALALVPLKEGVTQEGFGAAAVEGETDVAVGTRSSTVWRSNAGQLLPGGSGRPTATLGVIGGGGGGTGNLIYWPNTNPFAGDGVSGSGYSVPIAAVNPGSTLRVVDSIPGANLTALNGTYPFMDNSTYPFLPNGSYPYGANGSYPAFPMGNMTYPGRAYGLPPNVTAAQGPGVGVGIPNMPTGGSPMTLQTPAGIPGAGQNPNANNMTGPPQLPGLPALPMPGGVVSTPATPSAGGAASNGAPMVPGSAGAGLFPASGTPAGPNATGTGGAPLVPGSMPTATPGAVSVSGAVVPTNGSGPVPTTVPGTGPGIPPGSVPGGVAPGAVPGGVPGSVPGPGDPAAGAVGTVPAGLPIGPGGINPGSITGPLSSMFGSNNAGTSMGVGAGATSSRPVEQNLGALPKEVRAALTDNKVTGIPRAPTANSAPAKDASNDTPSSGGAFPVDADLRSAVLGPPPPPPPPAAYLNPNPGTSSGPRIKIDRRTPSGPQTAIRAVPSEETPASARAAAQNLPLDSSVDIPNTEPLDIDPTFDEPFTAPVDELPGMTAPSALSAEAPVAALASPAEPPSSTIFLPHHMQSVEIGEGGESHSAETESERESGDEVDEAPHDDASFPMIPRDMLPPFEAFPGLSFADVPREEGTSHDKDPGNQTLHVKHPRPAPRMQPHSMPGAGGHSPTHNASAPIGPQKLTRRPTNDSAAGPPADNAPLPAAGPSLAAVPGGGRGTSQAAAPGVSVDVGPAEAPAGIVAAAPEGPLPATQPAAAPDHGQPIAVPGVTQTPGPPAREQPLIVLAVTQGAAAPDATAQDGMYNASSGVAPEEAPGSGQLAITGGPLLRRRDPPTGSSPALPDPSSRAAAPELAPQSAPGAVGAPAGSFDAEDTSVRLHGEDPGLAAEEALHQVSQGMASYLQNHPSTQRPIDDGTKELPDP